MLIFTIAVSFEIKAGKITKEKFKNIKDNEEYKSILVSSRVLMDNRQFYIKEFDGNYYYNFKSEFRFFKFIEYYVRTRIFDMKLFKEELEAVNTSPKAKKVPSYKKILVEEYWKVPDEKFGSIIEKTLNEVQKGEIELIDVVKLFEYFVYFSKSGLIRNDIPTLKTVFLNGMNLASLHSRYCPNVEEELGKVVIRDEEKYSDEDLAVVMVRFNELNNQLLEKEYREKADEIFKYIPMKMEQFYERFDKECSDIPILKYYDPFQVFQRVSCASNEDIVAIKEKIVKRAKENPNVLREEKLNLGKLKRLMDEYISGKDITIKVVLMKEFSKELGEIIEEDSEAKALDDGDIVYL